MLRLEYAGIVHAIAEAVDLVLVIVAQAARGLWEHRDRRGSELVARKQQATFGGRGRVCPLYTVDHHISDYGRRSSMMSGFAQDVTG